MLDEVVRRNRRRSGLLALAGIANAWLVFSLFASIGLWVLVDVQRFNGKDVDAPVLGVFQVALVLAVLPTAAVVAPVLRIRDTTVKGLGAVVPGRGELPRVENLLSELALATGTPTVRAALLADDAPNALAVGLRPRYTMLVVTSGLVEDLTRDELEAVLAALLCSVRRWDTALRTVSVATTSFTGMLYRSSRAEVARGQHWMYRLNWASWLGVLLTWPSMACGSLVRRGVIRAYDFGADDMAVAVTRHPDALVSALRKLRDDPQEVTGLSYRNAPLWFEPVTDDDVASYELRRQAFAPAWTSGSPGCPGPPAPCCRRMALAAPSPRDQSAASTSHSPWKPNGSRTGSFPRTTGPPSTAPASNTASGEALGPRDGRAIAASAGAVWAHSDATLRV